MSGKHPRRFRGRFGDQTREVIMEYALRGTILWARVSSERQAAYSINSKQMQQESAWEFIETIGIPRDVVMPFWAFGESGFLDKQGAKFDDILELIDEGRVGLIVVHEHHRMARKLLRAATLFDRCAQMGVVFYIAGGLRDPGDPNDLFFLQTIANSAEWQVRSMMHHNTEAKFFAAQELRFRYRLPAGWCWASPDDADYRRQMEEAGLLEWLIPERLAMYRAKSILEGRSYYPLPFPDRAVFDALSLSFLWLEETRSVFDVAARIRAGESNAWPAGRAGYVPTAPMTRWKPNKKPVWERVELKGLYAWLRHPAHFGIYAYYSSLGEQARVRARRRGRVKSVHYGRAIEQTLPNLPSPASLIGMPPHSS